MDRARKNNQSQSHRKKRKTGEVYLILGENGRYKIGYSKNANDRVKTLRLSSCEDHTLIHTFRCNNPQIKEQELHELFSSKRNHSEWFSLSGTKM